MSESLFTSQTPTSGNNSDGGAAGIDTATSIRFALPGLVSGIRFFSTVTVGGTYTGRLYHVDSADTPGPGTGTLLASKVMGSVPTSAGWNVIAFDSPVPVLAGNNLYRAVIHNSQGRYVASNGFFAVPLVNGNLTAPASGTDPVGLGTLGQGTFAANAPATTYPNTPSGAQASYFADVVFDTAVPPNQGSASFNINYGLDAAGSAPCPDCPPTTGFFINLTAPGFINIVTGVGACVIEALGQTPAGAPCRQCLLLPTQQIPWDNCGPCDENGCPGQVALAIREVYGSERFPSPLNGASWRKCNHRYEIARAVVSVTRCVPAMAQDGTPPTCADELAAAVTLENDRTAVRQAIACCLAEANRTRPYWVSEWVIGSSTTVGELGGCAGVETEFLVGVQSCLCPD